MGVDVYGRKPTTKHGEYFRASIFSWPTVLEAMRASGLEVPRSWAYNDGAGLETQEQCDQYADAIEAKFDDVAERTVVLGENMGNMVLGAFGAKPVVAVDGSAERLGRWISFLRACGGFQIF